jgi:hypothetical protein
MTRKVKRHSRSKINCHACMASLSTLILTVITSKVQVQCIGFHIAVVITYSSMGKFCEGFLQNLSIDWIALLNAAHLQAICNSKTRLKWVCCTPFVTKFYGISFKQMRGVLLFRYTVLPPPISP